MRIPLLILGTPSLPSTAVRLSAGKYNFIFENVAQDETNLPAEIELFEAQIFKVEFKDGFIGRNINIFAERLE